MKMDMTRSVNAPGTGGSMLRCLQTQVSAWVDRANGADLAQPIISPTKRRGQTDAYRQTTRACYRRLFQESSTKDSSRVQRRDCAKPKNFHSTLGTRDGICFPNGFDSCDIAAHYNRI